MQRTTCEELVERHDAEVCGELRQCQMSSPPAPRAHQTGRPEVTLKKPLQKVSARNSALRPW
eukprot:4880781-Amphidinium_carterae.1